MITVRNHMMHTIRNLKTHMKRNPMTHMIRNHMITTIKVFQNIKIKMLNMKIKTSMIKKMTSTLSNLNFLILNCLLIFPISSNTFQLTLKIIRMTIKNMTAIRITVKNMITEITTIPQITNNSIPIINTNKCRTIPTTSTNNHSTIQIISKTI